MSYWLRNLLDRYDMLSVRERSLVLVAVLVFILVVWDAMFSAPRERERKVRQQQVESLRTEVAGLEESIQLLASQREVDPNRAIETEIAEIQKQAPQIAARLEGATTGLIGPEEMTKVLRQLLRRVGKLELRGLRTLEAAPVMDEVLERASGGTEARIFKHGLELELGGTYMDVLHFLQAVEALQWRFFWDHIEFEIEEHPQARVRLVVYTLSLEEGWIGV